MPERFANGSSILEVIHRLANPEPEKTYLSPLQACIMIDNLAEKLHNTLDWFSDKGADLLVGAILLTLFSFIGSLIRKQLLKQAAKKPEKGVVIGFIGNIVMAVMIVIGVSLFLREMGWSRLTAGLLAGAGFISIIIGIAFKDIGENFLAGILLAFSRPFQIGDRIEVDNNSGRVLQLNLRNTHLRTSDGRDVFIPNSLLVNRVLTNYTRDGLMRHDFYIEIDDSEDIGKVTQLILKTMEGVQQVQQGQRLKPFVLIDSFGSNTVKLKVFLWLNLREIETSSPLIKSRVMKRVHEMLQSEGVSMPGSIVEIKNYEKPDAGNK